jgi:hypothetical protein
LDYHVTTRAADGRQDFFTYPILELFSFFLAAFENAFVGNEVFKKYMPDTYKEMVAYIRGLK